MSMCRRLWKNHSSQHAVPTAMGRRGGAFHCAPTVVLRLGYSYPAAPSVSQTVSVCGEWCNLLVWIRSSSLLLPSLLL